MTASALANPYEMLGVSRHATAAEIRRAWLDAIKRIHPDHARSETERLQLEELARELNAAYHAIKDPTRRADVDAELRQADDALRTVTTTWPQDRNDHGSRPAHQPSPPPMAGPAYDPASNAASVTHRHHYRTDLFSRHGLYSFLAYDRVGQWLVGLTWLAVLSWVLSLWLKLDGTSWLLVALAGFGLQAIVAHRLEHTPLHDLMRASRTIVIGLLRLIMEVASSSATKPPPPRRTGRNVGWNPRWEDF